MTVKDWYKEAIKLNQYALILLIEFLVYEKAVIKMTDQEEKLFFYLQPKFHSRMNDHLKHYHTKIQLEESGI
ncbi:hypothetical protein NST73_06885 [Bacillus sp. FSL W7-1034]|uniref:hypothetical protein n=1 Tax=Bacillus TaxID=1386 RepID=UPI0011A84F77|nr:MULTISPECIES: hypothetical protein [Bacillus]MCI9883868.1 hypothetical protein [Bacillus altitudinis]MEC3814906.1 hypothetical protein [Bacillus altitudinis]